MGTVTRSVPGCPVVSVSGSRQFPERASWAPPGPSRAARGPRPVQGASVGPALYPLGLLSTNELAVCVWGAGHPLRPHRLVRARGKPCRDRRTGLSEVQSEALKRTVSDGIESGVPPPEGPARAALLQHS